jgi:hypothetical protein
LQANTSDQKDQASDQATASEEGTESLVAGWRREFLTTYRFDLHSSCYADAESSANIEDPRGDTHFATAAHHVGQSSTESADGDDVAEFIDSTTAILSDEATFAPATVQSATKHIRVLLDTPATFASRIAWQNDESVNSYRTSAHPEDGGRGM